jgi:hypothetical protein
MGFLFWGYGVGWGKRRKGERCLREGGVPRGFLLLSL